MKSKYIILSILALCCACSSDSKEGPEKPDKPGTEQPVTPEKPQEAQNLLKEEAGYPDGVKVWYFKDYFEDGGEDYCSGYYAIADVSSSSKIKFNCVYSESPKTPLKIFSSFDSSLGTPLLVTNGGYFYDGKSLSLLVSGGEVKSIAAREAWVNERNVYAVRAAFGQMADGTFESTWVYCPQSVDPQPYSYPSPLDNNEKYGTFMASAPTTAARYGGKEWKPVEAIGAGPMLVKDGKDVVDKYYWRECLDSGGTQGMSRAPRTCVAATAEGKVIVFVCDGRGKNGSKGFTLSEMAKKVISLGAVQAVNLDGGGSSAFVGKDGKVLNCPSDGSETELKLRSVPTAIVLSVAK